jgi:protein-disulfide isomerase
LSNNGMHVVVAALILGVCMIGGAYLVSGSIDRVTGQIPEFESAMKGIQTAVAARGGPAPAAPARRRGPDPSKVYQVASAGAPFKGPANAKITVVEFADFQ